MGGCKTFFLNSNIILTIYLSESDLFNGDFFFRFQEDNITKIVEKVLNCNYGELECGVCDLGHNSYVA